MSDTTVRQVEEKALETILANMGSSDTVDVAETALRVWRSMKEVK